ncbi:Flagellar_Member_7 [Leishmania braziliensis MHOM/BR/75/M2904]|uniref:Flagellar_Member_7 n=1 Tax=Leishmania braziliensis MHOM/BR/75/M2904 TaxID=420245 RepID=A0A3P3ZF09_LEIBR|nr:Flagellar_Member_7 [Leishmania braziliensis MHOM/BR/75/M2904]
MLARRIQRAFRRRRRHSCYPLASGQLGRYAAVGGRHGAQHRTATQLQRIARGWLARRHYTQLRQYARESSAAASRIQCWIRALQARRRYAALHAEKALQEAEALEHERRQYAATRIAGQWLTYVQRKACKVALRNRMMARAAENAQRRTRATICIQSAWRGYQARRLYRGAYLRTSQLRTARLEYEQRRQAAVRLQSFGRMLIARQNATPLLTTARLRAAAEIRTRSREGLAAITIQCAYRSHVARRVCGGRRLMRKELTTQALLQAHTAIVQRTGRGYMVRKDVGTKLSALQAEADRYERRLRALRQQDLEAARRLQQAFELNVSGLREGEDKKRCALVLTEQQQRHHLLTQCNASLAATSETEAQQEGMIRASLATFHNFSRIIKAKKRRALRQEFRDAYLERCAAEDAESHREASARVVTAFMRGAAARSALLSRAETMSSYNDARAMQEKDEKHVAMTTDDDNGEDTYAASAEVPGQLAAERAELDRLRRAERLASEAPTSAPRRPLTAEQLAAERAELDRLRRAERLASEAPTSAPRRPLTAEQLAAERAELDRLRRAERLASEEMMRNVRVDEISAVGDTPFLSSEKPICSSVLAREMMACQKAVWQAEVAAEKQRRQQRDALHRAIFEDRQQRIASATDGKELAPYRISRIRRQIRSFGESNKMALSLPAESSEAKANNCHARRIAQQLVAVQCIESHFLGRGARKHLTALLRIRDDYLSAMQTFDRDDGPVLTTVCLREALARHPDLRTRVLQFATYSSPSVCRSIESVPSSASPSASLTSRKTLKGYLRIIKAKKRRALRQESRDAYLERCAAEDAESHREASARVVTAFMRGAAARSALLSRAETMSSYNDARAMQEKDEKHVAMTTDDDNGEDTYAASAEVPGQLVTERAELDRLRRAERLASEAPTSAPRRPLTAEQLAAERAELDRLRRAERLASEAPTSAPRRPLTAEQLVTERAELDSGVSVAKRGVGAEIAIVPDSLMLEQRVAEDMVAGYVRRPEKVVRDDEVRQPPRRSTEQQVVVECLALGQLGHLEQVGMEGRKLGGLSLVEYTLSAAALRDEMVQGFQRNSDMECTWTSSSSASSGPSHREDLTYGEACDRLSVFAEVVRDKKNLRQRQAARDTYLQDVVNKSTSDVDEEKQQEERASTPFAGGSAWQLCSEEGSCDDSDTVDQEAMLQLYRRERRSFASSLVDSFLHIIKAKKRRALRQEFRDAYLERCAAEDAESHREASARVVTAFMRGAAARSALLSRAETMSSYNDARAMQEKDEKHVAMTTDDDNGEDTYAASAEVPGQFSLISSAASRIQRFVRAVQAGRMLRAQQESCRAYLEEERAVEEILHSAALTIQRLYRRHRARRLAAMAIVERDLCLLSPQESCEAKAACEVHGCDMATSAALSFRAHSLRGVISGCAEAAATSAFPLHRTSSSSCSELCELDSTAIVTVVSEAKEAALDQLVHRS